MSKIPSYISLSGLWLSLVFTGCSGDDAPVDAGAADSGASQDAQPADTGTAEPDAGVADSGVADAGETPDAGETDAGTVVDIRISGLTNPVEVRFDARGMTHIKCQTNADCFAAEGYFHAAHRFGQMDTRRRIARGRLAEIFGLAGDLVLNADRQFRSFLATRTGGRLEEVLWANSNAETRAMLEDYTRGVNAWIEDLRNGRNGARLTQEWSTVPISAIADWDVLDSVACALPLMEDLTNNSGPEINAGEVFSAMPASKAFDLFGPRAATDATILPLGITGRSAAQPKSTDLIFGADVSLRMLHATDALREARGRLSFISNLDFGRGSNNWVVAPSQTDGDYALLSNDPHLALGNPTIWYLVHLDSTGGSGDIHVAGVSFAGLPGILIGQNADLAWGMTTTFFDMADVYLEELAPDGSGVMLNGQVVPFVESEQTFERAGFGPLTETFLYVPHHGPVVSMDMENGTAVTIKWTGQDADTDLNFFLAMMRADSVAEARTAASNITSFGQNIVVADKAGSIAWLPYNRLPTRPWASALLPPWLPLPGDGTAEWGPPVPYTDLPQAVDPPAGYLATANGDMTGTLQDGDPTNDGTPWHQTYAAVGYRQARILQLLAANAGEHTTDTMQASVTDTHSLLAEETLPHLLAAAQTRQGNLSAEAQMMMTALEAWQYQCPTGLAGPTPESPADTDATVARESIGCAAFHVLWEELDEAVFRDDFDAAGLDFSPRGQSLVVAILQPGTQQGGDVYWDDLSTNPVETSTDTIVAAVESAATWLTNNLGPMADDWRWGRIHHLTVRPDLGALFGNQYINGPFAGEGGLYTVNVANPRRDFTFGSGPSMRYVCEVPSAGPRCTVQLPGGQRNFPESPHYDDLFMEWLTRVPHTIAFTDDEVGQVATETVMIQAP